MTFLDLADNDGFRTGMAIGGVALVCAVALALAARLVHRAGARTPRPGRVTEPIAPVGGFAAAIAGVVALEVAYPGVTTDRLLLGLALLLAGPSLVALLLRGHRAAGLVAALSAVPGAVIVARVAADVNELAWVEALVVVGVVVGGALVTDVDRFHARAGLGPVLLAITITGCYVTLPDTEYIAVLLGVVLPLALLGFPVALGTLGPGTYATLGLLAWVAAVEGAGRSSAVVGAFSCLGILAVEPVVRRVLGPRARVLGRPVSAWTLAVIVLQCGVVAVTSRIAGLEPSATRAGVIALGAWAAGAVVLALLLYPWPLARSSRRDREPASAPTESASP